MSDAAQLALICGTSTAVNALYVVKSGGDLTRPLIASGLGYVALSVTAGITKRWDLVIAIATVFMVGSIIVRGLPLIESTDVFVNRGAREYTPTSTRARSTVSKLPQGGSTGTGQSGNPYLKNAGGKGR